MASGHQSAITIFLPEKIRSYPVVRDVVANRTIATNVVFTTAPLSSIRVISGGNRRFCRLACRLL
jgi:hypothetical protein